MSDPDERTIDFMTLDSLKVGNPLKIGEINNLKWTTPLLLVSKDLDSVVLCSKYARARPHSDKVIVEWPLRIESECGVSTQNFCPFYVGEFDFYLIERNEETVGKLIQFFKTLDQATLEPILRNIKTRAPRGEYKDLMTELYEQLFLANTL